MKKLVFSALFALFTLSSLRAATLYVNDAVFAAGDWCTATGNNTTGNGTTAAPYATLGFALSQAAAGDVIRIDAGTYNNENNLSVTLANLTIEGKNIGTVIFQRTSGVLNFLSITANNVTVRNITVQNYNSTSVGLGKAISANNVTGALIYNCNFQNNSSGGGEPAVYSSNTAASNVSVTIRKCSFRGNGGNYGGGISVTANTINTTSTITATIDSCYFENNSKGTYYGGAIVIEKGVGSAPSAQAPVVTISNSTIGNLCAGGGNHAERGGALYTDDGSVVTINNTCISNNTADDIAGPDGGGGIWAGQATLTINDCKFENNNGNGGSVAKYGGAIYADGGFNNNTLTINRTAFIGNTSNRGGGIYVNHCTAVLRNCLFYNNSGTTYGGGIACNDAQASLTVYNSTFSNNTTNGAGRGGAIDGNAFASPMNIKNCILYGNGTQREISGGTNIQVRWSCIGTSSTAGVHYTSVTGNTTANPLFTNPAASDYTISSTLSPAYNTGNTDGGNAPTNDINGINRTTLEMGCYAFGSAPILKWSCANPVNIASIDGTASQICNGGSVTLTASPSTGYTYSWTSSPVGFTSGSSTVTVSPTVTTVYTVALTNGACGIYGTASFTVTVNPLPPVPVITASGPITFCQGGSVTLTSSSATGNTWSTGATTQSITVNSSGTYFVTVSNASGCTATSASTTVTVNPNPATPTVQVNGPATFCQGDSVTLTSSSATNNVWSTNATTQSIVVYTGGNYSVTVTDASGCSSTSAATVVTVNPNPATPVITASGPTTFCQGDSVILSTSGTGTILWSTGDTTSSIVVNTSGNYSLTITNNFGCSAASAVTAVVVNNNPAPPTIAANGPLTFCQGDSVTLSSSNTVGNIWSTGDTTQSIVVTNSGSYFVETSNTNGCTTAGDTVQVTVNPTPSAPMITAAGPTNFCQGDSVILTSSYPSGNVWSTGDSTASIVAFISGTYTVFNTSAQGCSSPLAQISVTVNSLPQTPVISASGPLSFCSGDSVTLNASASPAVWNTGDTTISIVVNTGGNYSVSVTDTNGCSSASAPVTVVVNPLPPTPVISTNGPVSFCSGDSLVLTSSEPFGNVWSTGDTTQSVVVYTSGIYTLYVSNSFNCASASDSVSVTAHALPTAPVISLSGPATFCLGDSVTLSSSVSIGNIWSTGATSQNITVYTTGIYTVMVTDSNGCSATSAGIQVTANPVPAMPVITAAGPTTLCEGQTVTLTSSNASGNTWNTGATTPSITVDSSGTYSVITTNTFGCSSPADSITILVNPSPQIDITAVTTDTAFCGQSNGSINGIVISNGSSPYSFSWYDAQGNPAGDSISLGNVTAGGYVLIVTDANGCADTTNTINVPSGSGVQVTLSGNPLTGYIPLSSYFTASTTIPVSQYNWDFGNGNTSVTTTDTTSFLYTSTGTFPVTVWVTDAFGCTDSASVLVVTDEEVSVSIPNVFTPNGDGTNDFFLITTTGVEQLHVEIYDRWGVLIRVIDGVNTGWDGHAVNGMRATDGTYYYILDYTTYSGEMHKKTGFVTLIH